MGKRITDQPLVTEVIESIKMPTGEVGDLTISVGQLKTHIQENMAQLNHGHVMGDVDGLLTSLENLEPKVTATTAADYYRGDKTFQPLNKTAVGLANVDNTSDLDKPISNLTQTALDTKEPTLAATTSADYYRGDKTFQPLNKAAVGLSSVDNTSDLAKPLSTSAITALADKLSELESPAATGEALTMPKSGTLGRIKKIVAGQDINLSANSDTLTVGTDGRTLKHFDEVVSTTGTSPNVIRLLEFKPKTAVLGDLNRVNFGLPEKTGFNLFSRSGVYRATALPVATANADAQRHIILNDVSASAVPTLNTVHGRESIVIGLDNVCTGSDMSFYQTLILGWKNSYGGQSFNNTYNIMIGKGNTLSRDAHNARIFGNDNSITQNTSNGAPLTILGDNNTVTSRLVTGFIVGSSHDLSGTNDIFSFGGANSGSGFKIGSRNTSSFAVGGSNTCGGTMAVGFNNSGTGGAFVVGERNTINAGNNTDSNNLVVGMRLTSDAARCTVIGRAVSSGGKAHSFTRGFLNSNTTTSGIYVREYGLSAKTHLNTAIQLSTAYNETPEAVVPSSNLPDFQGRVKLIIAMNTGGGSSTAYNGLRVWEAHYMDGVQTSLTVIRESSPSYVGSFSVDATNIVNTVISCLKSDQPNDSAQCTTTFRAYVEQIFF